MNKKFVLLLIGLFVATGQKTSAQTLPGTTITKKSFELKIVDLPEPTMPLDEVAKITRGMNTYIGSYPPNFQTEEERDQVYDAWLRLVSEAEAHAKTNSGDEDILAVKSELYRQGHNMDVVGSAEKAFEVLENCLSIYPKSVPCNFSSSYFFLSIGPTYLDNAEKSLNILRAHFAPELDSEVESGYVYLHLFRQQNDKAKTQMQNFITAFPDEPRSSDFKQILAAFENGKVERVLEDVPEE